MLGLLAVRLHGHAEEGLVALLQGLVAVGDGHDRAGLERILGELEPYLTQALTLQHLAREGKVPLPCGAVAMSPWLDLTNEQPSREGNLGSDTTFQGIHDLDVLVRQIIPEEAKPSDPTYSALFGEWSGLPPMFFLVGDTEVLLSDTLAAVTRAREAGVEVRLEVSAHGPHVYPSYCLVLPEAREALGRIAFFVWECLGGYTGGARAKGPGQQVGAAIKAVGEATARHSLL